MNDHGWLPEAPDGHEWVRPRPADCPNCPCHTALVCQGKAWHWSYPRHEGCPCETAAVAADTPPATRTLTLTVADISRTVLAQAPTVGIGAGLLLTARVFRATGSHLAAEAVVPMVLSPASEHTPADLVAVDELGQRWTMRLTAFHGGAEVAITGWHDA
ncbi:hypothetical protein ACFWIB_03425 [Streptomyces sp. NPDC127051]|uniref:hypothetical protein n=1 Tax=Streptomyces sp. NPDC127051 TaxID=3347119 RepID=UPI0036475AB4